MSTKKELPPVSEEGLRMWLEELHHLRRQRTELQQVNTRLELENRDLRGIVCRLETLPNPTPREARNFATFDEAQLAELAGIELRRSGLWMRLRGIFGVYE